MVLLAALDKQKDEKILCNYEPSAAKDDNVALGQFIRICDKGVPVDSCFKRARSQFFLRTAR